MRNIVLTIEYDGTRFYGWQQQLKNQGRTIQGEIEIALEKIVQEKVRLTGAGRTDSGVHAIGQVANFFTNSSYSERKILSALNGILPADVRIKTVTEADFEFNSRKDALRRKYRYVISLRPTSIHRFFSWYYPYPIRLSTLHEVARLVLGAHDFSAFCKSRSLQLNNECIVMKSNWTEKSDLAFYEIEANRFLHHMVRSLVGTMLKTAEGKMTLPEFRSLFVDLRRDRTGKTAPARGLFLDKIFYRNLKNSGERR